MCVNGCGGYRHEGACEPGDEPCPGCGDGDKVPSRGDWRCPVCDAEWFDFDPSAEPPDAPTELEMLTVDAERAAERLEEAKRKHNEHAR